MKVILFNAPAGVGKDVAAEAIWLEFQPCCEHRRFKDRLFEITAAVFGISVAELTGPLYTRENKEKPTERLKGLSPRQALIKVSEDVIKPTLGQNFFGEALADSLDSELTVISDSGFFSELLPVVDKVGAENVLVVRVIRPGYTFVGDSRDFLSHIELKKLGVEYKDIVNKSTLEDFKQEVQDYVSNWIQRKENV